MVSKMEKNGVVWIASRNYRAKRRDVPDAPWRDIYVAISMPRKLSEAERPIDSDAANYGCTVQVGAEFTRHIVAAGDALGALFHGILAIDAFLMNVSKEQDLQDENGENFDANVSGLLFGPIAREYSKNHKS